MRTFEDLQDELKAILADIKTKQVELETKVDNIITNTEVKQ